MIQEHYVSLAPVRRRLRAHSISLLHGYRRVWKRALSNSEPLYREALEASREVRGMYMYTCAECILML